MADLQKLILDHLRVFGSLLFSGALSLKKLVPVDFERIGLNKRPQCFPPAGASDGGRVPSFCEEID